MTNNSCYILPDYLGINANQEIFTHTIGQHVFFRHTKTVDKNGEPILNEQWRHSYELPSEYFEGHRKLLKEKVLLDLSIVFEKLVIPSFEVDKVEIHLTAHNHGEFYKPHIDNGKHLQNRIITFVYYFHSIPKQFEGGQLLFLRNKPKPLIIEPVNNSIVFFDSSLLHAVHPVSCVSKAFEHSRFTLNGWIWKKEN